VRGWFAALPLMTFKEHPASPPKSAPDSSNCCQMGTPRSARCREGEGVGECEGVWWACVEDEGIMEVPAMPPIAAIDEYPTPLRGRNPYRSVLRALLRVVGGRQMTAEWQRSRRRWEWEGLNCER
jgi:hypothetical protein